MTTGTYTEYKQYTNAFLAWIQRAFVASCPRRYHGLPMTLTGIKKRVEMIVTRELEKSSEIWKDVPKMLKSGSKAISIRTAINNFHLEIEKTGKNQDSKFIKGNADHTYCIELLRECHEKLKSWYQHALKPAEKESEERQTEKVVENISKFHLDDDAEMDSKDGPQDLLNLKEDKWSISVDEIDLKFGDLRLDVVCLLLEIKDSAQRVMGCWEGVRNQTASIQSAVMVTYGALREIRSLNNQLEFKFPSLVEVDDFVAALEGYFSEEEITAMANMNFFKEFFSVAQVLSSLGRTLPVAIPLNQRAALRPREDFYGIPYNEKFHKFEVADRVHQFLGNEFAYLYNSFILDSQERNDCDFQRKRSESAPISGIFLDQFDEFFKTGKNTMSLSFAAFCWLQVVAVLQDQKALIVHKVVYMCRKYCRTMKSHYENSRGAELLGCMIDEPNAQNIVDLAASVMKERENPFDRIISPANYAIINNNPFLAGAVLIDCVLYDFRLTTSVFQVSGLSYRGVPALYKALRRENYLKNNIEVLDRYIDAMKSTLGCLNDISRGNYLQNYLLSTSETTSGQFFSGFLDSSSTAYRPSAGKLVNPTDLSKLSPILSNDLTQIYEHNMSVPDFLKRLEEVTNFEFFSSRILSVDWLKYYDAFHDFFFTCRSIGSLAGQFAEMMKKFGPAFSKAAPNYFALAPMLFACEHVVLTNTLSVLDLPSDLRTPDNVRLVQQVCACLIQIFGSPNQSTVYCNENFFIFPESPNKILQNEFGAITLLPNGFKSVNRLSPDQQFAMWNDCMDKLDFEITASTPIKEKQKIINQVKQFLKICPDICFKADFFSETPFLLDCAIGSTYGRDDDFAEWIIALGGYQSRSKLALEQAGITVFQSDPSPSHLQVAIQSGNKRIFPLLLAIDRSRHNLNYQRLKDGCTALHYAAASGDGFLIESLLMNGADGSLKNHLFQTPAELVPPGMTELREMIVSAQETVQAELEKFAADDLADGPYRRTLKLMKQKEKERAKTIQNIRNDILDEHTSTKIKNSNNNNNNTSKK